MVSSEPTLVTVPLFRTDIYVPPSRAAASTLTTIATKITMVTATSTTVISVTEPSAALPTSTGVPPLPAAFDSPLATGKVHTPAVAIVTLVAVILCALLLLVALCYFIIQRFRGKCPHCPRYEDELRKYKNSDSVKCKSVTTELERTRDLEKGLGPMDEQAHQHRLRMRAQSLARLESQSRNQAREDCSSGNQAVERLCNSQINAATGQRDSGWSSQASLDRKEESKDFEKEQEQIKIYTATQVNVQKPVPAHLAGPVDYDDEATLVNPALRNPDFDKTHDDYLRDVVAPRETERKAQEIAGWLDIASDPNTRESVKVRAVVKANAQIIEMDTVQEGTVEPAAVTRQVGRSRFREHLSWDTKSYNGSV